MADVPKWSPNTTWSSNKEILKSSDPVGQRQMESRREISIGFQRVATWCWKGPWVSTQTGLKTECLRGLGTPCPPGPGAFSCTGVPILWKTGFLSLQKVDGPKQQIITARGHRCTHQSAIKTDLQVCTAMSTWLWTSIAESPCLLQTEAKGHNAFEMNLQQAGKTKRSPPHQKTMNRLSTNQGSTWEQTKSFSKMLGTSREDLSKEHGRKRQGDG